MRGPPAAAAQILRGWQRGAQILRASSSVVSVRVAMVESGHVRMNVHDGPMGMLMHMRSVEDS
jgi:hypothetical protein